MNNRDITSYGGQYRNARPVKDPTTEPAAEYDNRLREDVAQMTRTSPRAWFSFNTVASGTATVTDRETHWGTGASYAPEVERTGVGTYEATFASTYTDGLTGSEQETNTVSFRKAEGWVASNSVFGLVQCTVSGNVITITTFGTGHTAADLTAGTSIVIEAR